MVWYAYLRPDGATAATNAGVPYRLFKRHCSWRAEETIKYGFIKDSVEKYPNIRPVAFFVTLKGHTLWVRSQQLRDGLCKPILGLTHPIAPHHCKWMLK